MDGSQQTFLDVQLLGLSVLEFAAALVTLASVWLTVKQNVWGWPVGAVAVALYFVVFYRAKLYADTGLQMVYFVLQFYGWYQWLHGGEGRAELPVRRVTVNELLVLMGLGQVGTLGMGLALGHYTDAAVPYWDSTVTAFSLVAQWLLAQKVLENWLIWIAVD